MARGANVDFWGNYQKGQQAAFAEETWDARKRGIEAGVGERELALEIGKDNKKYNDQWASGWQEIMNNYIAQANAAPNSQEDWGSQVNVPYRDSTTGNTGLNHPTYGPRNMQGNMGGMAGQARGIASQYGGGGSSGGGDIGASVDASSNGGFAF